jgi:CBS-domain-containing membrane protein
LAEDAENRIPHVRPGTSATLLMHLTRTIHPPAGSNPVIVILSVPGWHFLITPTLVGAVTLVAVAAYRLD